MHLQALLAAGVLPLVASATPAVESRQATTAITINVNQTFQSIDGFGISEAFQRANGIYNLTEPKRTEVLDYLFNTTTGAGLTIVRNGVGSSPNSSQDWMNTILPVGPSTPDGTPNYVWDGKDSGQLWLSQQAVRYGVKTFYGDAWSAPGFMKTNGLDSNGGTLCGVPGTNCSTGDWRQAYANYFVEYINLYAQNGVNVTHLGFLNEPDIATSYASMQMNGTQAADFIKVLYPTLQKANLSWVQIGCCDATGYKMAVSYTEALADVADMMGFITQHEYTSRITGTQPTSLKVWESEYADLAGHWSTDWYNNGSFGEGLTWANNIYNGLTTGNVSAYLWWEGTQDPLINGNPNEKLILLNATDYQVSARLWAFAQFSRTARPGAVRIGVSGGSMNSTAFLNTDGSIAVNMINTANSPVPVSISGVKAGNATAWVTDNDHDMDSMPASVGTDGSVSGVSVPAKGMVSVVITGWSDA